MTLTITDYRRRTKTEATINHRLENFYTECDALQREIKNTRHEGMTEERESKARRLKRVEGFIEGLHEELLSIELFGKVI